MKLLLGMIACLLSAAAHGQMLIYKNLSYQELMEVNFDNSDCLQIDRIVNFLEYQQLLRGTLNVPPERLSTDDRLYNLRARALIWGIRVGCANPNRYKK